MALTGPNGAGKTNLLEAISLLAPGRGLRGAAYSRNWPATARSAAGRSPPMSTAPEGEIALGTALDAPRRETRRQSRHVVDRRRPQKSPGSLADHMRMSLAHPRHGPAVRRARRATAAAFSTGWSPPATPSMARASLVFEKLMRERNLLLGEPRPDRAWLSGLEAQMAEAAAAIAAARLAALEALQDHIDISYLSRAAFPWARSGARRRARGPARQPCRRCRPRTNIRRLLAESRRPDGAAGRTLIGPHRSDLAGDPRPQGHGGGPMLDRRAEGAADRLDPGPGPCRCSGSRGAAPILLLDEVAAHLDAERRAGLCSRRCERLGAQAWMTGTDREPVRRAWQSSAILPCGSGGRLRRSMRS